MTLKYLKKLCEISSESILPTINIECLSEQKPNNLFAELCSLLNQKNGLFAFESALLIRPYGDSKVPLDLNAWNKRETWINAYGFRIPQCYFFAEDIFGEQFAITDDSIVRFYPETGNIEFMADSLEDWAKLLLNDYDYFTGYTIAHQWQVSNGLLKPGMRLIPKKLFMFGGKYVIDNLVEKDEIHGMRIRGEFASLTHDIPDETPFKIDWTE